MKKLSIKEKAKAYDRVAKEVRDFFEGKQKMYNDVTKALEFLFPELKESEDDKIKREIIEYIKTGTYKQDWIGWLEKQKPSPTWSEEDEKLYKLSLENLTELMHRFGEEYGRVGDCIDWFESIKDKFSPIKKSVETDNVLPSNDLKYERSKVK